MVTCSTPLSKKKKKKKSLQKILKKVSYADNESKSFHRYD